MKAFYSDYVRHCMRFYARHPHPKYRGDVDKENWIACDNALKGFSAEDRELILSIYRDGETIPDNIRCLCAKHNLQPDAVWKLLDDVERKVAKRRGLR